MSMAAEISVTALETVEFPLTKVRVLVSDGLSPPKPLTRPIAPEYGLSPMAGGDADFMPEMRQRGNRIKRQRYRVVTDRAILIELAIRKEIKGRVLSRSIYGVLDLAVPTGSVMLRWNSCMGPLLSGPVIHLDKPSAREFFGDWHRPEAHFNPAVDGPRMGIIIQGMTPGHMAVERKTIDASGEEATVAMRRRRRNIG